MRIWDHSPSPAKSGRRASGGGLTILEALETARARSDEIWGQPSRCPKCRGRGYLDRIDLVDRVQHERCTECGHKWSVAESEAQRAF